MLRKSLTAFITAIIISGCANPDADLSGVGVDKARLKEIFSNNIPYFPGMMTEENFTGEACGNTQNEGCYRIAVLLNENTVILPRHKYLNRRFVLVANKRGRQQAVAGIAKGDNSHVAVAKIADGNSSAQAINFTEAKNFYQQQVVVGSFDARRQRPVARNATITGFKAHNDGTEFIELTMTAKPGDIGGPVLSPSGELAGIIVANPFGKTVPDDVQYAVASSTIRGLLTESLD